MPTFLKSWAQAEPTRLHALIGAVLAVAVAFGLTLTGPQTAAILALAAVVFGTEATALRSKVTPEATVQEREVNAAAQGINIGLVQGAHAGLHHPEVATQVLQDVAPALALPHDDPDAPDDVPPPPGQYL